MEKKTELKPVRIDLICDECKEPMIEDKSGENSALLLSVPRLRRYFCKNNHSLTTESVYPRIDFVELSIAEMFGRIF